MDALKAYFKFISSSSSPGSNLPGSYVRALRYTTELLRRTKSQYASIEPIWEISSLQKLEEIYKCVKVEERKKEDSVFITVGVPKSYWQHRYCSNAVRTFAQFLTESKQANDTTAIYNSASDPNSIVTAISKWKINPLFYLEDDVDANSKEGRDVIRNVKTRQNQDAFRRIVLLNYGFACCITGLPVKEALRASHIVGWQENVKTRLMPTNGLCLAATYDAAFDRHLITFDEDYRMVLSSSLKEYCSNKAFVSTFKNYEGKRISTALKFQPDQKFLAFHREQLK